MLLSFKFAFEPIIRLWKIAIFTYDLQFILINIKIVKGVHYSWHLVEHFTVVFYDCKSFSLNAIEVRKVYTNIQRRTGGPRQN